MKKGESMVLVIIITFILLYVVIALEHIIRFCSFIEMSFVFHQLLTKLNHFIHQTQTVHL